MDITKVASRSELDRMTPNKRDEYLCQTFCISRDTLGSLRVGEYEERLKEATDIVYSGEKDKGSESHLEMLTYTTLQYLTEVSKFRIQKTLKEIYSEIRKMYEETYNLRPPLNALLWEDVTKQELPFKAERRYWKGFVPSSDDWARQVTLPIPKMNRSESQLVGIIWGDGYLTRKSSTHESLRLIGTERDKDFYYEIVAPGFERMFNLPIKARETKNTGLFKGKVLEYKGVIIDVGSKAVKTWLTKDLGFSKSDGGMFGGERKEKILPVEHCDPKGMLEGLLSSMGSLFVPRNPNHSPIINFIDKDEKFLGEIRELAISLEFDAKHLRKVGNDDSIGNSSRGFPINYSSINHLQILNSKLIPPTRA